jgi:hypothetical protein
MRLRSVSSLFTSRSNTHTLFVAFPLSYDISRQNSAQMLHRVDVSRSDLGQLDETSVSVFFVASTFVIDLGEKGSYRRIGG